MVDKTFLSIHGRKNYIAYEHSSNKDKGKINVLSIPRPYIASESSSIGPVADNPSFSNSKKEVRRLLYLYPYYSWGQSGGKCRNRACGC
jgi:hypothetical protein